MLSTSSGKYEEANGLSWDIGAKKKKKNHLSEIESLGPVP